MRDVQDKVVCARVKTHLDPVPSLSKHSFDLPLVPRSQVKLHLAVDQGNIYLTKT